MIEIILFSHIIINNSIEYIKYNVIKKSILFLDENQISF